jgi:hypothetical protein
VGGQHADAAPRSHRRLSLFSVNSIFHMQFRQPMMISHLDPLVATV